MTSKAAGQSQREQGKSSWQKIMTPIKWLQGLHNRVDWSFWGYVVTMGICGILASILFFTGAALNFLVGNTLPGIGLSVAGLAFVVLPPILMGRTLKSAREKARTAEQEAQTARE